VKKAFKYIALFIFTSTALFGQTDTTKVDSLQKEKVERYLEKLIKDATETAKSTINNYDQLEIDELIVNATISKPGNDFFYYYSNSFVWPEAAGDFIVQVTEKPFRLNNTQISIKVNDLEVFQNMLQPRTSYLEELAIYAQQVTVNYIVNYQQIMKELDGDDRSGSGIY
jgi:curli production assembly/transport component CsgE